MKFISPLPNLLVLVPSNSPTHSQDNQTNNFCMKNIVTISAPSKYSSQLALSYSTAIIHMFQMTRKWWRVSMIDDFVTPGGATENSAEFSSPPDYRVVIFTSPWHDLVVSD